MRKHLRVLKQDAERLGVTNVTFRTLRHHWLMIGTAPDGREVRVLATRSTRDSGYRTRQNTIADIKRQIS